MADQTRRYKIQLEGCTYIFQNHPLRWEAEAIGEGQLKEWQSLPAVQAAMKKGTLLFENDGRIIKAQDPEQVYESISVLKAAIDYARFLAKAKERLGEQYRYQKSPFFKVDSKYIREQTEMEIRLLEERLPKEEVDEVRKKVAAEIEANHKAMNFDL